MECKNTKLINQSIAGLTLVELMIGLGISSIVVAVLGALTIYSARSFRSMVDYAEINQSSRMTLDQITREIRQSRGIINSKVSANSQTLLFKSGGVGITTFSIAYNKTGKTLKLTKPDGELTLKDCTYFNFQLFQQSPQSGSFDFAATTDPLLCKMVQLDWVCGRTDVTTTNSESIQSMKVVIRKKS